MSEEQEFTESGQPIYRHRPRERPFEPTAGDEKLIQAVSRHIERHWGRPKWVLHEIISDLVHVDVHVVAPTEERNCWTLVTSGMSERSMNTPPEMADYSHAELLVSLPADWPVSQEAFEDERNYWPVRWLKMLARLPHEYDTWLGYGHTVPNGDPPEPYAPGTELCCMILLPSLIAGEEFFRMAFGPETTVHFYALMPLYREEMELKLRKGTDALLERLDQAGIGEIVDPTRPNVGR